MSKQTIDSLCALTSVRQFRSVICAAACLVAMNAGWAATWYVDAGRPDDSGDGTTWATAKKTIQAAIDIASNDVVLVTNGVYATGGRANWPAGYAGTTRVVISNAVIVRAVSANPAETIISGAPDSVTGGVGPDAIRGVYVGSGAQLIGFTVSNGCTRAGGYGGGIYAATNSVVSNCVITTNQASYGGGIYAASNSHIANCMISSSQSGGWGGGVYIRGGAMLNCTIVSNFVNATGGNNGGGGISADGNSVISDCMIITNTARFVSGSGGLIGGGVNGGKYYNCLIAYNYAVGNGGGAGGSALYGGGFPRLYNCQVISNCANDAGGLFNPILAQDCLIQGNEARYGGGGYGGTYVRCGIIGNNNNQGTGAAADGGYSGGYAYLTNCLVAYNIGGAGVGSVIAQNCTIVSNKNYGVRNTSAASSLTNCIVYDNTPADFRAGSYYVGYACARTNIGTFPGAVNIVTNDPIFVDSTNGDFRLHRNSPCLNCGLNQDWMTNAVDLDGRARIFEGVVDLGAYETAYAEMDMKAVDGADGGGVSQSFSIGKYEVSMFEYLEYLNAAELAGGIVVSAGEVKRAGGTEVYCLTTIAEPRCPVAYDVGRSVRQRFYCAAGMEYQPVIYVSWFGAAAFCNWRSVVDGFEAVYEDANGWTAALGNSGYRLPTEAQWLKAAAWDKNTGRFFEYGTSTNTISGASANYLESGDPSETNDVRTTIVGSYAASSPYELKDAAGNVWEWCHDFFTEGGSDPDVDMHAVRGGGWGNLATDVKTSSRGGIKPGKALNSVGFRIAAP